MKDNKLNIIKNRRTTIYVYAVICLILFSTAIVAYATEINVIDKGVVEDFSKEWKNNLGVVADFNKISKYSYIEKEIPEISSDCMLFFKTNNANVEIFKNDVCVLSTGKSKGLLVGKTNGKEMLEVPLYTSDSGGTIRIDINVPYSGSASISDMYIGNELTYIRGFITRNIATFVICASIMIIGILQIFIFLVGRKQGVSYSMLFLGLFTLMVGSFLLLDTRFLQYTIGHSGSFHYASEMLMTVLAVPFVYFIKYNTKEVYDKEKPFWLLVFLQYMVAIACFVLNILGIFDYHETIILCHIEYGLVTIYFTYKTRQQIGEMNRYLIVHLIAMSCLLAGAVGDMVLYYISEYQRTTSCFVVGMLLFSLLEMTDLVNGYIVDYKNRMRSDLENHLNFHDGLTDLFTKTTYTEEIKRLSHMTVNRVIAIIRVTGVSKINEEYGYRVGDEIIIYVAQKMKKYLNDNGRTYRLGGNEMVFISDDGIELERVKKTFLDMKNELLLPNDIVDEPVVIAYGLSEWDSKDRSYDEAFENAVKSMFEYKRSLEL